MVMATVGVVSGDGRAAADAAGAWRVIPSMRACFAAIRKQSEAEQRVSSTNEGGEEGGRGW